jgi:uncharacterized protein YidB (DUF937 family)
MSLLDTILGSLGGAAGGAPGRGQQEAPANPLLQIALQMLTGASGQPGGAGGAGGAGGLGGLGSLGALGGLGGLIQAFQRNGLGEQMQSWIGTGQNLPVSADQLQQVLGADTLSQISQQMGMSHGEASSGLAELLPQLIDRLTPQGQVPQQGLGDLGSILQMLGRR